LGGITMDTGKYVHKNLSIGPVVLYGGATFVDLSKGVSLFARCMNDRAYTLNHFRSSIKAVYFCPLLQNLYYSTQPGFSTVTEVPVPITSRKTTTHRKINQPGSDMTSCGAYTEKSNNIYSTLQPHNGCGKMAPCIHESIQENITTTAQGNCMCGGPGPATHTIHADDTCRGIHECANPGDTLGSTLMGAVACGETLPSRGKTPLVDTPTGGPPTGEYPQGAPTGGDFQW